MSSIGAQNGLSLVRSSARPKPLLDILLEHVAVGYVIVEEFEEGYLLKRIKL